MAQIKACIFDLDGVLVDTAVYHFKAWKKLANLLGFDFTKQQNESLKGVSRNRSLQLILEWGGLSLPANVMQELADQKNSWYVDMISSMTPQDVLPGVTAFLSSVREEGMGAALGSASKNAPLILERTGLHRFFDVIVDGNIVAASKPDPAVFLKGATLLRQPPAHCLVFEDAAAGVQAALAAGMSVVGVGNKAVLEQAGLVVKDLSDVAIHDICRHFAPL